MRRLMTRFTLAVVLVLVLAAFSGCGSQPDPNVPPADVQYANYIRTTIDQLVEEPGAIASTVESVLEPIEEGSEEPPASGEHKATYDEIFAKFKELRTMTENRASQSQLTAKVQELVELGKKLPGTPAESPAE